MTAKKRKHEDTSVSLHPLAFEEAVKKLADAPKTDRKTRTAARSASNRCVKYLIAPEGRPYALGSRGMISDA